MENSTTKLDDGKKKSSRIFLIYFSTLVYTLITTASITDAQLILNDPLKLPLINTEVSITTFFIISPIILILLFTFFNVHLFHLKRAKIISDNYSLWPVFEFREFDPSDKKNNILNHLQISISNIIIWGLLPLTLLVIWFRYSNTHNIPLMLWQFIWAVIGSIFAGYFWNKNNESYKIIKSLILIFIFALIAYIGYLICLKSFFKESIFTDPNKDIFLIIIVVVTALFISTLTSRIINEFSWRQVFINLWILLLISPLLNFHYLLHISDGEGRNIDLSYQIIAQNPNIHYQSVYSVNLRSKRLEGANLMASILVNVDLREAQLQHSSLNRAKLNGADLSGANLSFTDLRKSDFSNAILLSARLDSADLRDANLSNSNLKYANFTNCDLRNASLKSAILDSTNFTNADLRGVFIHDASWGKCLTLYKAKLDSNGLEYINTYFPRLLKKR